MKQVEKKT
jgi:hypothetical protein